MAEKIKDSLKHGYVYQDKVNGGFIIEIFRGDKSEKKISIHTLSIQDDIITAQLPEDEKKGSLALPSTELKEGRPPAFMGSEEGD